MARQARPKLAGSDLAASALDGAEVQVDDVIDPPLLIALEALEGQSTLLPGMARYHLGYADETFAPVPPGTLDRGKRFRPAIALLAAGACGGDSRRAAPLAAAIELLHNFTLIHDDIQDHSETRRHRTTVWKHWGVAQAINAGDALFAASHLPIYALARDLEDPLLALRIADDFDQMAIAIVEGQTLDLGFESRIDVTSEDYLAMIAGKTAAIVQFAAWAGALVGGANDASAAAWRTFGLDLGLGFQIRDDLLGIWGTAAETGKAPADDIRRRKKSFPLVLLQERLATAERQELAHRLAEPVVEAETVDHVLQLLDRTNVRAAVEAEIALHHDRARAALFIASPTPNPYRDRLLDLVETLSRRRK
ncbi:MAG: polyprenyl synthetase family protein [Thermomicrobiales bacterium]